VLDQALTRTAAFAEPVSPSAERSWSLARSRRLGYLETVRNPHAKPDHACVQQREFTTTHWSVVLAAGRTSSPEATEALETLCHRYWYPLYAYVRRRGYGPQDAEDLTQGFFARLLAKNYVGQADRERGKFRTFLLSALNHFLADEWDRAHRLKRGGGQPLLSLDAAAAEERYTREPVDQFDAAKLFERRWATTLLERAMARLEQEYAERDQNQHFEGLRAFLVGDGGEATYAQAAPRLGLTVAAMKMAVSRMRARCRELLREEIAQTVAGPREAEEEYRALVAALGR
jgi:RNA polymerase sigma-70 factor (ECF subfamily)